MNKTAVLIWEQIILFKTILLFRPIHLCIITFFQFQVHKLSILSVLSLAKNNRGNTVSGDEPISLIYIVLKKAEDITWLRICSLYRCEPVKFVLKSRWQAGWKSFGPPYGSCWRIKIGFNFNGQSPYHLALLHLNFILFKFWGQKCMNFKPFETIKFKSY